MATKRLLRKGPSPNILDGADGIAQRSLAPSAVSGLGSCTAHLVISKGARSIREIGAVVALQGRLGNDYMVTVSLNGETKYAVKADQPIDTGTSDRCARSMTWKGGEDWSLEFVDRKQWRLFLNLHKICVQRNVSTPISAPAVPLEPIALPGVRRIEEVPHFGPPYARPPFKHIRQYYGEADLAFLSLRIVYDMDSEDEEWLNQFNSKKRSRGTKSSAKVEEDTFEKVIDKLEKTSVIRHQEAIPAEIAAEICQNLGSQDEIMDIHSYWSEKRRKKGMSLVRYFQPAPSEQYEKQLKERDMKLEKLVKQDRTEAKWQLRIQTQVKKPALFAFCMRKPKKLETSTTS